MAVLSKWASFVVLQNRNRQTFHHILVDFKANQVFYNTYAHTFCTPNYKKELMHSLNTACTMKVCHQKDLPENIQYPPPPTQNHTSLMSQTNTEPSPVIFRKKKKKNTHKASFVSINIVLWSETLLPHIATLKQFITHSDREALLLLYLQCF